MATSVSTGGQDTNAVLADEKVVDMDPEFKLLDPDESQFSTMSSNLRGKPSTREKAQWLEDQYFPNYTTQSGGATNSTTTINVAAGTGPYFRANDIVFVPRTGEVFSVTSIATDALTVVRGIGGVAGTAINDTDDLLITGNASAQFADVGVMAVTTRVLGFNYTQIQRNPFGFSETDLAIDTYGSNEPMTEMAKKAVEHKRALENSRFFGGRKFTAASPNSKGYMGGVTEFISTNKFTSIGTLTRSVFDAKLQTILQHGSRNKVIFSAPTPAAALSGLLADNWVKALAGEKVYGAKVNAFVNGAFGTNIPVVVKREWGVYNTANNQLGSWMVVLDMDYIRDRPLRGRGTKVVRNLQGNGVDGEIHEYKTETTIEVAIEQSHGILKGITG